MLHMVSCQPLQTMPTSFCRNLKDKFITRRKKITQQIDETELNIGYQFMTEEDMTDAGFPQPLVTNWIISSLLCIDEQHHVTLPSHVPRGGRLME